MMKLTTAIFGSVAFAVLGACGDTAGTSPALSDAPVSTAPTQPVTASANVLKTESVNSAVYELEKTHASLIWTVSHNGLSKYTTRFADFDVSIQLDAENPSASSVTASINPLSVRTDHPSGPDWDATLGSDEKWFNGTAFPEITYASTSIVLTGDKTGTIMGDLTLLGVSLAVPLDVTYNNVRNFAWYGERDVIGFSATANLKRSDFGMLALLPDIGDEVSVSIEVEFVEAETQPE